MPSPAAHKYHAAVQRTHTLCQTAKDRRLRPLSQDQIQTYYHAALAANVAAWDTYIKNLIIDFYAITADPFDSKFNSFHSILKHIAENGLEKFNTPNWENARKALMQYTGYDPISDWVWPPRMTTSLQVKERLNEILKVRHSFAHGFGLPAYPWTQSISGRVRLTSQSIYETEAFFRNLIRRSDSGMKHYLITTFAVKPTW